MWKKHHVAILIIAGIGLLYLLYEWYYNSVASADSSAALDTSNLPTVISTGGGGYTPSVPSFTPQDFSSSVPQPLSPTQSAADSTVTSPGMTVMPGTSQSGVPASSAQTQEFNTNPTIASPSPASTTPSYYASAQDLPYNNAPSTYVANPVMPGSNTADLATYLGSSLRSSEIDTALNIGNDKSFQSSADFQTQIQQSGSTWLAQHPEAGVSDNAGVISDLVNQYNTFVSDAQSRQGGEVAGSQPSQYVNPTGVNPVGTPIQVSPGVWQTPNQIASQTNQPTTQAQRTITNGTITSTPLPVTIQSQPLPTTLFPSPNVRGARMIV